MVEHPIGNVLWRNDGPGCGGWCWRDASAETRTGAVRNGMGLTVGDYDNDLDLDFYFSDMGEPMSLLQNVGGRFRNATEAAGVAPATWSDGERAFFAFRQRRLAGPVPGGQRIRRALRSSTGVGLLLPYANVLFRNRGYGNYVDVTAGPVTKMLVGPWGGERLWRTTTRRFRRRGMQRQRRLAGRVLLARPADRTTRATQERRRFLRFRSRDRERPASVAGAAPWSTRSANVLWGTAFAFD